MIIKSDKNVYKNYFGEGGISKIYAGYDLVFGHDGEIDYSKQFFSITAIQPATINLTSTMTGGVDMKYSYDEKSWTQWDYANETLNLPARRIIYFKGDNPTGLTSKTHFVFSNGNVEANGNIFSLIFDDNFMDEQTPPNYAFNGIFQNQTNLVKAPYIPPYVSSYCYYSTFWNTGLIEAPELPATTLAAECYREMFTACHSLTQAPELPATNLANGCYSGMFNNCENLIQAPELPATTLASQCYSGMFKNCVSLTQAPELPATTLGNYCYDSMFYNCTSLTQAPELPATRLIWGCYDEMFWNCTGLTQAPELPATTLASSCYTSMFRGCSNINYIKTNFLEWTNGTTSSWVENVSQTGTFVVNSQITWDPYDYIGVNGIPEGWLIVDENGNEYQKSENPYAMPYLFKVSYNDGNQDVTITKDNTDDKNNMITNDEWINAAYRGTYNNKLNQTISQIWIGDECEYIGDYNDPSNYNANTTSDIQVQFIKGTTSKKLACKKIVVGPNVKKIVGNQVMMHALATSPRCFVFLGDKPELPYSLKLSGDFQVTGSGTEEDPYTTQSYVYVKDELVNDYYTDSSFLTNNYGYVIEPTQDYQVTAKEKRRVIIKPLSEYDSSTFGDLIDPVPVQGE